ncbi:MAG TPA: Uma2 family endonuclease [Candidatus Tumulicola sp.]|nr:Uma2 family endonuclease [Candidatus Tumulicola sp.]
MSVLPQPPGRLLTIREYADLGEIEHGRYELQEGRLVMSPSPTPDHMIAIARLYVALERQIPNDFAAVPDVDVDLQLAPATHPGSSRRPDLLIVRREALGRVRKERGLLRAGEVLIVIEVVSPGSERTDYVVKRGEYAGAGIPYYWVIDLDPSGSLTAYQLAGGFGYQENATFTGTFETDTPFAVRLKLEELRHK